MGLQTGYKLDNHRGLELNTMDYIEYVIRAAQHSRYNAGHWFRYLRKLIDKHGIFIAKEQLDSLYRNESLTPFQRVSLKAAFQEGTVTQQHIVGLNQKVIPSKLAFVRAKNDH